MSRTLIAGAAVLAALVIAPVAQAWDGAKWLPNTCGADLVAPAANGSWWVRVSDESGVLYENALIPGDSNPKVAGVQGYTSSRPLTVGGQSNDVGFHIVTYEVANAANHADGYRVYDQPQANCFGRPGPPGPAGRDGRDGVTTTVTVEKTVVIHEAPKVCTSQRDYAFRVRRSFAGQRITAVTATLEGRRITVRHRSGRLVVSWSTKGQHFTPGGVVRSVTVRATLANGKHVRLGWKFRPCMGRNGNLNDPSAAGQASTGGGVESAVK